MCAGARQAPACRVVGLDPRTVQRWRTQLGGWDRRRGPCTAPANALSESERAHLLAVINAPEFRDLPPGQIVPQLADRGEYVASESTMYRELRRQAQARHRGRSRPPVARPKELVATGPNEVWSWDITYLKTPVRGLFLYLYLFVDVWSRKIVGWQVHATESMDHAAALVRTIATSEGVDPGDVILHADNGGPMKGATMRATLDALGITPSFSRPRVSNDNPYSESIFRTLKYRPEYPSDPFADRAAARSWIAAFVDWYNLEHRHSAIRHVTPEQRHRGTEGDILRHRRHVYDRARELHPERWTRACRCWEPIGAVYLNPGRESKPLARLRQAA